MGLMNRFLGRFTEQRKSRVLKNTFKMFNGYSPVFTSYNGGLYEMELTRSSVHALATHTSKLNPVINGDLYKQLEKVLQVKPNSIMTTTQFLYRLRTIYEVENNAYIVPIFADNTATKIIGLYPVSSSGSELVSDNGKIYLKYQLNGNREVIEYDRVGHLRKHYYKNEFFGESNSAINRTLDLIHTQDEGIIQGIKQSAFIRFMARLSTIQTPDDMKKERQRFVEENLSSDNNGGVMLYDNKYAEVKQVESKPFIIDDKQSELIKNNVFTYFGVNESILQNKFNEDEWDAFYEGAVEPFAVQLSQVITSMLFNLKEIEKDSFVLFETSRLQYASNTTKLNIVEKLFDRGFLTHNQGLEIFNLPPIENGDKHYIRKEYAEISKLDEEEVEDGNKGNQAGGKQTEEDPIEKIPVEPVSE